MVIVNLEIWPPKLEIWPPKLEGFDGCFAERNARPGILESTGLL